MSRNSDLYGELPWEGPQGNFHSWIDEMGGDPQFAELTQNEVMQRAEALRERYTRPLDDRMLRNEIYGSLTIAEPGIMFISRMDTTAPVAATPAPQVVVHEVKEKVVSSFKHRFSDAAWYNWLKGRDVIVLGVGGIGSWVAMCLARIGCVVHIYDMDTVESHNLGGQLYHVGHVGISKTEATRQLCYDFSGREAEVITNGKYKPTSPTNPIIISAFDNMAGRQLAFDKWAEALQEDQENAAEYIFIDGRLLAEQYQVFAVTQGRLDAYKKTLFADSEVGEASCSLKSTTHCSMGIAADIVAILTNFATNRVYNDDIRPVPYNVERSIIPFMYDIKLEPDAQEESGGTSATGD